jgi:fructokinase
MATYAGVEAGGTSFCVAIARDPNITDLVERAVFPTTTPEETLRNVVDWLKQRKFDALGVASFGPIDLDVNSSKYGYITTTPKPNWKDADVMGAFSCFNVPKGFDTDVNGAAISEYSIGKHGKNTREIVSTAYITVGTGVGVGIVVDGRPVHGLIHPEVGHILVPRLPGDEAFKGTCPFHKDCVEGFVSTGALVSRVGRPATELPQVPDTDPAWEKTGSYLAALCANLVLTVSPSVIVIGGGVMNRDILYPIVRQKTLELLNGYVNSPLLTKERIDEYIVRSPFGNNSGIVGALELGRIALQKSKL